MGIFLNAVYSKIDVFVKFESAINLEIKVQIKKKPWIPFIWVTRITYMYSLYLTIVMIIIKYCMYAGASPGFGRGGGPRIFFFRFGNSHVAKRHAAHGEAMRIVRGVRGHAPPRKFFKTVQFGAF